MVTSKKKGRRALKSDGGEGRGAARAKKDERERDDRREGKDESEIFARRAEWFAEIHADHSGMMPPAGARLAAIEQMARLGQPRLHELDPGGAAPTRGFELIGAGASRARLSAAENPRPMSSFGFAAPAVELRAAGELPPGATLKIAIGEEAAKGVDLATVRVFRFEESTREWRLVARSGVSADGGYVFAVVRRPGLYVPVGLPADYGLMRAALMLHAYAPWLRAAVRADSLSQLLEPICKAVIGAGLFRKGESLASHLGLTQFDEGSDAAAIYERCRALDFPEGGLPEGELLKERAQGYGLPTPSASIRLCASWVSVGPNNFNGRIKSLVTHSTNGNILYAGSADGGVWKTTDGGANWLPTMLVELSLAIGALGISASNPNVLYAATGEDTPGWGPSYPGVGVYKTTGGGSDWDYAGRIPSDRCTRVLVHPSDPNVVYVAGNAGLHKSTDGGTTWTNVRADHVSDALFDPNAPNVLYAGVWNKGVYKSNDGGATWSLLAGGLPSGAAAEWIKLAMGRGGANGTSFLVAKMGLDSGLLYKSADAGATWSAIPGTHQSVPYNEWTNMVAVDPRNQNVIFAGGAGLERSTNGGTSFTGVGGMHSDLHALVFNPADSNVCYLATDGGVYKSVNNGVAWALSSKGLVATQLYCVGVSQAAPFVLGGATQDQGIIKSTGAADWADTSAGNEGGIFVVDPNNSNNIYVTPWSANLRRSTNSGASWTTILNGLGNTAVSVAHLAVMPGNSNTLLCCGGMQLFRSTNQGTNWTGVAGTTGSPTRVIYSHSNPSVCYAATDAGRVYKSSGGGSAGSWAEPYAASPAAARPPAGRITGIAVAWNDPNVVYITYGNTGLAHVYRSLDGGVTWTVASGALPSDALPDIPVSSLVADQFNPEVVYVATDIGVFRTRDGGDSWERYSDGMPRVITTELALHRGTNTLYASTMGRGAFKLAL
jgi:hypothetical protein